MRMQHLVINSSSNWKEGLIVPICKDDNTANVLRSLAQQFDLDADLLGQDFLAKHKEILAVQGRTPNGTQRIYLLGLGADPTPLKWIQAFRALSGKWSEKIPSTLSVHGLLNNLPEDGQPAIEGAVSGLILGTYRIGRFKQEEQKTHPLLAAEALVQWHLPEDGYAEALKRGEAIAETQLQIFDLMNAPSNHKTPAHLSDWAVASGDKHGYSVRVMEKAEIEAMNFHGLLAVNRGSEHPATFNILEYKPANARGKKIGLVGKGVTFDSGGVSLKPSNNMHLMKSDMGGAAAVFGTIEVAAKLRLPIHLIGIVPATDNSIDALAIKPSDVISSHSGKTIEIIDTDAEGRLILADGLSYMVQNYQPDVLIDLATLTGSVIRSLGYAAGGLFTNNADLAQDLLAAGQSSGERLWEFPMWEDYGEMIRSDVADVKNFSGKPMAGAITAAKFLEHFIHDHDTWAHLDIAGVAMSEMEYSTDKSGTAFGIRLLLTYIEQILDNK
jgi:leucyl aminopeptidase